MKIKLGVLFGGKTVEHEISIISAVQAMENLNEEKYDIIPIYIDKTGTWYTGKMLKDINVFKDFEDLKKYAKKVVLYNKKGSFVLQTTGFIKRVINDLDIVLPIVHGNNMEDGTVQGYLNLVGIPYVGSNILASSIGQDKVIMKQIMDNCDIPIVDYTWFYEHEYLSNRLAVLENIKKIGYPVIVKPATLGSSVGIGIAKDDKSISEFINEALKYDEKIIVEKVVSSLIEVNCSVIGNHKNQEASIIEEVISTEEFLSYSDKYINGSKGEVSKGMVSTRRRIPAKIEEKVEKQVKELAIKTFKCLNFKGVARIDFLIDSKKKKVFVNEPNTIPGSLSYYLWEPCKKYNELLEEIITLAIKDYKAKSKKIFSFDTNVLNGYNGSKGVKGSKKF